MKEITINGKKYLDFSEKQHIQKHTKRENTHCFECPFCEGEK